MILIIGGAYQGKLDYALEKFKIEESDVFQCTEDTLAINFDKRIINDFDRFIRGSMNSGRDPRKYLAERRSRWENTVFIVNDVSSGLVPADPKDREFRELAGRTTVYLGREARSVIRVFAGLGKNIK